ncbi:peptide deformylase [Anditalea andensis]|uniref:Peptide deformylase n=1 Tax=Anditalea andensis TaxID=1048983 RepID=A0A074KZ75_9BACT|nr:peptide deformylase [Anditalea andensis]KEO72928.1 formylmethionine deformylase [Anditalea andensis]
MKSVNDILKLGDPRLYETCEEVREEELPQVSQWVQDLHEAMEDIREKYAFGRGIAAPQLGIMKRLFYLHLDKTYIIINPDIVQPSEKMIELWDDCMSFPNLLVKIRRHESLTLRYKDENWADHEWHVSGALSELIQHEYDHLEGVLCTMRAIDEKSFKWRGQDDLAETGTGKKVLRRNN